MMLHRFGALGLFAMLLPGGQLLAYSDEPIELPPREIEFLTVRPRIATAIPTVDPSWLHRGAVRADGSYESPLPPPSNEINRRQIELLRTLDKLQPLTPDENPMGSIADKLGKPEVLTVPPRITK